MSTWKCTNDRLGKYLFTMQPELLLEITKYVTKIPSKTLAIINSEVLPEHSGAKEVFFDLFLRNENGILFDVEIQNGILNEELVARMEYYDSKMLTTQINKGQNYASLKDAYVIILLNNKQKTKQLIEEIYIGNKERGKLKGAVMHYFVVHMAHINQIKKKKKLVDFNIFVRIIYALYNNLSRDILELEDEVILKMEENVKVFFTNEGHFLNDKEKAYFAKVKERETQIYIELLEKQRDEAFELRDEALASLDEIMSKLTQLQSKYDQLLSTNR